MFTHKKSNYRKLSEEAMARNPKSEQLTDQQKEEIIEANTKISQCLHAEWQMLRATSQFHADVFRNMYAIYDAAQLDADNNLCRLRRQLHECAVLMARQDMTMDEIYKTYTKKLFPNTHDVAVDDSECYSVLYDIITTAFGCDAIGSTKESDYTIIRIRKSYLNTLFAADPRAKENVKLTSNA